MMQLAKFLSGHFASNHSPERERREAYFAKKKDPQGPQNTGGPEREQELNSPEMRAEELHMIGNIREGVKSKVDVLKDIGTDAKILLDIASDSSLDASVKQIAQKLGLKGSETWTDENRHQILDVILKSPLHAVTLSKAIQARLDNKKSTEQTAEEWQIHITAYFSEFNSRNQVELTELFKNPEDVTAEQIEALLELPKEYGPDRRRKIVDNIVRGFGEIFKKKKLALKDRAAKGSEPEEDKQDEEFRKKYYGSLEHDREVMIKNLEQLLEERARKLQQKNHEIERALTRADLENIRDDTRVTQTFLDREIRALRVLARRDSKARKQLSALYKTRPEDALLSDDVEYPKDPRDQEAVLHYLETKAIDLHKLEEELSGGQKSYEEEAQEQETNEKEFAAWAEESKKRVDALLAPGKAESLKKNATLRKMLEDKDPVELLKFAKGMLSKATAGDTDGEQRQRISTSLSLMESAGFYDEIAEDKVPDLETLSLSGKEQISSECDKTEKNLAEAMKQLISETGAPTDLLKHTVCDVLRIPNQLFSDKVKMQGIIGMARQGTISSSEASARLAEINAKIKVLESAAEKLSKWNEIPKIPKDLGGAKSRQKAYYDQNEKTVYFDSTLEGTEKDEIIDHEKGHFIIDVLTRRSQLFPELLIQEFASLNERVADNESETFYEVLQELGKAWGLAKQRDDKRESIIQKFMEDRKCSREKAEELEDKMYKSTLMDELMNAYASWRATVPADWDGEFKSEKSETARLQNKLFRRLNRIKNFGKKQSGDTETLGTGIEADGSDSLVGYKMHSTDAGHHDKDEEEEEEAEPGTSGPKEEDAGGNAREDLDEIKKNLFFFAEFRKAYPGVSFNPPNILESADVSYKRLEEIFLGKDIHNFPKKENDPGFINALRTLKAIMHGLRTDADKFDAKKLDTTKDPQGAGGLLEGIHFLSVYDVMKFWNDSLEDIKNIYKRAQDRSLKAVGRPILKSLQIGKGVPLLGKYMDNMALYHERRYSGSEEEESNKWKDGLATVDSHSILHMLHHTDNKDQLRGSISLLCHRGEMDWNEEGVWRTLSRISRFDMPFEACKRSDVLRDTWLRKMISSIWDDKELYYHWRQENDSSTDSAKQKFSPTVDQLSNVGGGMKNELEKQLRLWVQWNSHHPHVGTPPEDVKPHLYEEVITYAIDKGKMSMEQKMYYLVQGVATGLLSIDRLRVLASKFLNQFPLIDYFYGRNNTMPEIQALAERLKEPGAGNEFKPGIRTTLWLQYEVTREKSAQERLSKALSGARAENIDHEDVPFFITNADVSSVDNMTGAISGTRLKLSPEGTKNAYAGWNSKFKAFGALSQAEKAGKARVTKQDVEMLTQTLIGYVRYDNIVTRNVCDLHKPTERAILTQSQFMTTPPSASKGATTWQYRQGMTGFLSEIMKDLKNEIQSSMNADASLSALSAKVEDYVAMDPATLRREKNNEDRSKKLYALNTNFENAFIGAIRTERGQTIFKEALRKFAAREKNPIRFHNEVGSEDLSVKSALAIIEETQGAKKGGGPAH